MTHLFLDPLIRTIQLENQLFPNLVDKAQDRLMAARKEMFKLNALSQRITCVEEI